MKVVRVKIHNVLGLEHLEFEPGKVTVVEGANATGKTSVLEALKTIFEGGHDATLLRQGADKGEVVLVLDDGVEIRKTVTADSSSLKVSHPQFGQLGKAQTYLQKLADALSVNPLEFLTASDKERVSVLLEAIPMTVTDEQIGQAVPESCRPLIAGISTDAHALQVIAAVGKELYTQRTGVNRAAKEKRATASQMRETLPEAPESGDWSKEFEKTKAEYLALQKSTGEKVEKIKAEALAQEQEHERYASKAIADIKQGISEEEAKLRAELQTKLDALKAEGGIALETVSDARNSHVAEIRARKDEALTSAQSEYEPRNQQLSEALSKAKAMMEAQTKAASTRGFIDRLDGEAGRLEETSEALTRALGNLEGLKSSLLESLPIKGLEIRDGQIYLDGIPFDRVNTAKQVQLAIEVSKLRAGPLGLVAVDNVEHLDAETFKAFAKAAQKSKLQFVVSRVTSGPLTVGEAEEVA